MLTLLRPEDARAARERARLTYGDDWRDTLILQMADEMARLRKRVADLEGRERV
jgi:hypothetical protein